MLRFEKLVLPLSLSDRKVRVLVWVVLWQAARAVNVGEAQLWRDGAV